MSDLIISSTDDLVRRAKDIEFRLDNLFNLNNITGDAGDPDGDIDLLAAQLKEAEELYRQELKLVLRTVILKMRPPTSTTPPFKPTKPPVPPSAQYKYLKLAEVNASMSTSAGSTNRIHHHRNRLRDYNQTIQRLRQLFDNKRARHALLSGHTTDPNSSDVSVTMNMLMGDSKSLGNSNQDAKLMVEHGSEINQTIARGRQLLEQASNRVRHTIGRFGASQGAMTTIGRAKIKNTLILGVVIGLCICFLLWWFLSSHGI